MIERSPYRIEKDEDGYWVTDPAGKTRTRFDTQIEAINYATQRHEEDLRRAAGPVKGGGEKAMTPKLIRLPDGNWVNPCDVVAVTALPRERCDLTNTTHADRVVVKTAGNQHYVVDCESWEDAEAERDRLAETVNSYRG